jgi:hypothetical protein
MKLFILLCLMSFSATATIVGFDDLYDRPSGLKFSVDLESREVWIDGELNGNRISGVVAGLKYVEEAEAIVLSNLNNDVVCARVYTYGIFNFKKVIPTGHCRFETVKGVDHYSVYLLRNL